MTDRSHERNSGQLTLSRAIVLGLVLFLLFAALLFYWQSGGVSPSRVLDEDTSDSSGLHPPAPPQVAERENPQTEVAEAPVVPEPLNQLAVVLIGSEDAAVKEARVWAVKADANPSRLESREVEREISLAEQTSDAGDGTGVYVTDGCGAGDWKVIAQAPGYATGDVLVRVPRSEPVTIKLEKGFALEGRVLSSEDQGIVGASIVLLHPAEIRNARGDEDGRFSIEHLSKGQRTVVVSAPGFSPRHVQTEIPRDTELEVFLGAAAILVGRVIYAEDREPLEKAFVYTAHGVAISDAAGEFQLDNLPGGSLDVFIDHDQAAPGHTPPGTVTVVEGQVFDLGDFELEAGVFARFGVTRADGRDAAGLEIRLHADGATIDAYPPGRGFRTGVVDERGRFFLPGLMPGRYLLTVADPQLGGVDPRYVDIPEGADAVGGISIVLLGRVDLMGRVEDGRGQVVPDAMVTLTVNPLNALPAEFDERALRTEADGQFTFRNLREEEHHVSVEAEGFVALDRVKLWPQRDDEEPHVLKVLRVHTALGQVVGPKQERIPGARVYFKYRGETAGMPGAHASVTVKTESDGTFEARPVVAGPYDLAVDVDGYQKFRKRLELAGDAVIELEPVELSKGHRLVGRVVDASGEPRPSVLVQTWLVSPRQEPAVHATTRTRDDGSFALYFDNEGIAQVELSADSIKTTVYGVEVPGDMRGTVLDSGLATGAVLAPDGTPVRQFVLETRAESRRLAGVDTNSFESGDGRFSLRLSPEVHEIRARAKGFAASTPRSIRLKPGSRLEDVDFTLRLEHRIEGEVVDATTGDLVDGARVYLSPFNHESGEKSRYVKSNAGAFLFDQLRAGRYRVSAGDDTRQIDAAVLVDVVDGVELDPIRLELRELGAIQGRLTREGIPVAGVSVGVAPQATDIVHDSLLNRRVWSESDADGFYDLASVSTGSHRLRVSSGGRNSWGPTVEVSSGEVVEADIELPGGVRVEGFLLSGGGEAVRGNVSARFENDADEITLIATSSEDGAYTFDSMQNGTAVIQVEASDNEFMLTLGTVVIDGTEDPVRRDFTLPGGELSVRLRAVESATPILDAPIYLWPQSGSLTGRPVAFSDSRNLGTTRFNYLEPGTYRCAAVHRDRALTIRTVEVRAGTPGEFETLAMARPTTLEVNCVSLDGKPVEGATLAAVGDSGVDVVPVLARFAGKSGIVSDPRGIIRLRNLAPGSYSLRATNGDSSGEVHIAVGGEIQVVEVILAP